MIDGFNTLAKRVANQVLGQNSSILVVVEERVLPDT
jgi:hypothetical protein